MIAPMANTKLEIVWVKQSDELEPGLFVLGDISVDSASFPAPIVIGAIGEFQVIDLPNKQFTGRIVDKSIMYSNLDVQGKAWDLVTRVVITLQLTSGTADPALMK